MFSWNLWIFHLCPSSHAYQDLIISYLCQYWHKCWPSYLAVTFVNHSMLTSLSLTFTPWRLFPFLSSLNRFRFLICVAFFFFPGPTITSCAILQKKGHSMVSECPNQPLIENFYQFMTANLLLKQLLIILFLLKSNCSSHVHVHIYDHIVHGKVKSF